MKFVHAHWPKKVQLTDKIFSLEFKPLDNLNGGAASITSDDMRLKVKGQDTCYSYVYMSQNLARGRPQICSLPPAPRKKS